MTMELLASLHGNYQPAQRDEQKTLPYQILKGVTVEENAGKILALVN